jgi:hypothetical protein
METQTSDTAPATSAPEPASSPEPTSLQTTSADVIRESISSLPDAGDDRGNEMPAGSEPPPLRAHDQAAAAEVDELARALGIELDGKAKWTSRVAYSKVAKIVKEREQKAQEAHQAAIARHEQQIAQFDQLVGTPEALLGALASINPAYRRFLGAPAPAAAPAGTPERIETMADLQRVIDAQVAQRLQPIEAERQQRTLLAESQARVARQMADIQTWPGFTEHKGAIEQALTAEMKAAQAEWRPLKPFDQVYREVVFGKLAATRDQVRQDVLAEVQNRPHSTSVTKVAGGAPEGTGPRSSADIIRDSIRGLK